MEDILLRCTNCGNVEHPDKTNCPKLAVRIECNYCPNCSANTESDFWEESFYDKDDNELFRDDTK